MGSTIIESYTFVQEEERVVQIGSSNSTITTRIRIKKDNKHGEFFPEWEHEITGYSDTGSHTKISEAIRYWETYLENATSKDDFKINPYTIEKVRNEE